MFVEAQLTKYQFNIIQTNEKERFLSKKKNSTSQKNKCYPKNQYISVTDSTVDIKLQALLDRR